MRAGATPEELARCLDYHCVSWFTGEHAYADEQLGVQYATDIHLERGRTAHRHRHIGRTLCHNAHE